MADGRARPSLESIQILWSVGTLTGMGDPQLLERFVAGDEPAAQVAFAALVRRHGPMVMTVCRQWLADPHAAEDAFQATFLVLARKAHRLRQPDLLGPWLHVVATRTARKARASERMRDRRRQQLRAGGPDLTIVDSTVTFNLAAGGSGGFGTPPGSDGRGLGGGISVAGTGSTQYNTKLTHNFASTSGDNVSGSLP
jgi:hypothetical protein